MPEPVKKTEQANDTGQANELQQTQISQGSASSSGSQFEKLAEIFDQIAEAPKHQQNQLLQELCPDLELRRQVKELLDADSASDQLLDHSLFPEPIDVQVGQSIAGYTLLEEIAQGGMGVVFLAEQTDPIRRKVALKVIKPGVDTREVIARFDAERQALSLMDHPNIAKVMDAGSTETGRPFFAMELVNGHPITNYCTEHNLTVKERLQLFVPVCHAIQHAHQKGIIHRDIKPSNVLVAEYDGNPVAKVIDFGVAKAINQSLTDMTRFTGFGQIIGTFDYMSPEQSRVNQLDVDTRSDIYSLGVLLYELLTENTPFDKDRLRSVAWDEMLRIIREENPPKPSARLSQEAAFQGLDPKHNRINSAKHRRTVRGELDWIVLKAMDKDRNRRYESPIQLAGDIQNFLSGDSVSARPPSKTYRFGKFAKRNKVAIATSAVVLASLVVGLIGTRQQATRAWKAEEAAATNAAEAKATNLFLTEDLLGLAGAEAQLLAGLSPDPNLKLETLLDRALAEINGRFDNQPDVKANLQATLAKSFDSIGRYQDAAKLYRSFLTYLIDKKGISHKDTIMVMRQLVRLGINLHDYENATTLCEDALKLSHKNLPPEHNITLQLLSDQATLFEIEGNYRKAVAQYQKCMAIKRRQLGDLHPDTLGIRSNLALVYEMQQRYADAKLEHEFVLESYRQATNLDPVRIATSLVNLGRCNLKSGRRTADMPQFAAAADLLDEGLMLLNQIHRPNHPDTLQAMEYLAQTYCELRQYDRAEGVLRDLVAALRSTRGVNHLTTLEAMNMWGWSLMHLGRLPEAEHVLDEAATITRRTERVDFSAFQVLDNLASVYYRMGKLSSAISLDEEHLALAKVVPHENAALTFSATTRLGLSYLEVGRTSAGRKMLTDVFESSEASREGIMIAGALANSYAQEGDFLQSKAWIKKGVEQCHSSLPSESLELADLLVECGSRYIELNAWKEAEVAMRECLSIGKALAPNSTFTFNTQSILGQVLSAQQKHSEAEHLLLAACQGLQGIANESPEEDRTNLRHAFDRLVHHYTAMKNEKEAAAWIEKRNALSNPNRD